MRALHYIIDILTSLYILVLLLRLLLPYIHASFNNPIVQGILRITSPIIMPIRRVIPPIGRLDTATLIVAYAVQYGAVLLIVALYGFPIIASSVALTALFKLAALFVHLFAYALVIKFLLSWFAPGIYNPAVELVTRLTDPLLAPVSSRMPRIGGLDLSLFFLVVLLFALGIFLSDLQPYKV